MRYVLDTNIILHIVRNSDLWKRLKTEFRLTDSENKVYISIVSYAEIKSLAKQLDWGKTKLAQLETILKKIPTLYLNTQVAEYYVDIDVYSQGKIPNKSDKEKFTARNMGKNDLWIAATTKLIDAELITTDNDFLHLSDNFFKVHVISQI